MTVDQVLLCPKDQMMEWLVTYIITSEDEVTVVRFLSDPTVEELRQIIQESENFDSELELWDFRACTFEFTSEQIQGLAALAKSKQRYPLRTAMVADQDLSYGMSRVYSAYRRQAGSETNVFRDEDGARSWLFAND